MSSQFQLLKSDIQAELAAIERIYGDLPPADADLAEIEDAIVAGYYLHNLYNAFESIFRLVAETFENNIPDTSRWHTLLLDRMSRDIDQIRPRLLSEPAVAALDELRRFRHLFRHLYRYELDTAGVQKALRQAHQLRAIYPADVGQFTAFLDRLSEE